MKESGAILQPVSHGYRHVYTLSTKTAPNPLPPLGVPCIFNLTEMRCNQWRMPCNIICGCACGSLHANIRLDFQRIANSIRTNYTVVVLASVTSIDLSCILFRIFGNFTTHTHNHTITHIVNILMHCEMVVANDMVRECKWKLDVRLMKHTFSLVCLSCNLSCVAPASIR